MSEYVTVPREPTPEMIAAGRKVRQDGFSEIAIFDAMIAAAPPAASVRARELMWTKSGSKWIGTLGRDIRYEVWTCSDGYLAQHCCDDDSAYWRSLGAHDTPEKAQAACEERHQSYVRSLLAPVGEAAATSDAPVAGSAESRCDYYKHLADANSQIVDDIRALFPGRVGSVIDFVRELVAHPAPASGVAVTEAAEVYGWVVEWESPPVTERHLYRSEEFARGFADSLRALAALGGSQRNDRVRVVPVYAALESALAAGVK